MFRNLSIAGGVGRIPLKSLNIFKYLGDMWVPTVKKPISMIIHVHCTVASN